MFGLVVKMPILEYLRSIPSSTPDSNFVLMLTLRDSNDDSNDWVPGSNMEAQIEFFAPGFCLSLDLTTVDIWGVNQQTGVLSLFISLRYIFKDKNVF